MDNYLNKGKHQQYPMSKKTKYIVAAVIISVINLILFIGLIVYSLSSRSLLNQMNNDLNGVKTDFSSEKNRCREDWIQYLDKKCFKVFSNKGSFNEAKGNCSKVDIESTLIIIQSEEEQIFLSNILENYSHISDYIWIGLEKSENKSYKWLDGNYLKYENWNENSDKSEKCVDMSLGKSSLGKWRDESCSKKHLIVCQKKQNTKTVFKEELKNLTKVIERQNNEIKAIIKHYITNHELRFKTLEYSTIPVGFIYVQLPRQSSPQELWPIHKWIEVTKDYSGLFFRAEGDESEAFGKIQQANQSWISDAYINGCNYNLGKPEICATLHSPLKPEQWKKVIPNLPKSKSVMPHMIHETLNIYTTAGEVRPKNTAIRIFKRI